MSAIYIGKAGDTAMNQPTPQGQLDPHDSKVIAFHIVIAMIQAGLMAAGAYHFGKWDADIALLIQVASELIRRLVV